MLISVPDKWCTVTTGRTLAVAPAHHERFAYFRLHDAQALDEMADFIAACGAQ